MDSDDERVQTKNEKVICNKSNDTNTRFSSMTASTTSSDEDDNYENNNDNDMDDTEFERLLQEQQRLLSILEETERNKNISESGLFAYLRCNFTCCCYL
jgi:hypothetical protein